LRMETAARMTVVGNGFPHEIQEPSQYRLTQPCNSLVERIQ
jgi:hypothetical protein